MPANPMSPFPVLTTAHLTLRPLMETDAAGIFALRSDENINRFLDRKPAETVADASDFINNIIKNKVLYWAITQTSAGKLIGTICLFDISLAEKKCEIGYELLAGYQGQGIMREAAEAIIQYAKHSLGVKTIQAFTHKDNAGSTQLLHKLNFIQTERMDETNADLLVFSLSV